MIRRLLKVILIILGVATLFLPLGIFVVILILSAPVSYILYGDWDKPYLLIDKIFDHIEIILK